jgi:hypothetical protein
MVCLKAYPDTNRTCTVHHGTMNHGNYATHLHSLRIRTPGI